MRRLLSLCLIPFAVCGAYAQGHLYKSIGPDGKVTYSDTPPPAGKALESQRLAGGGAIVTSELPYELAQAARLHPVTLYTSTNCPPCDEGRKLLTGRGIPFHEKTVNTNDDIAQLQKISNSRQLPLLLIGRNKQPGFEAGNWNLALTAAGYPATSQLPRSFRNPPPEAAASVRQVMQAQAEPPASQDDDSRSDRSSAVTLPPPVGKNVPPGFRF